MNTLYKNRQHYPALDGLRGIAILLVVIYHNFGFIDYFFFGWLGVDLFFVLSGFLITDILLRTVHDKHYLRNFYIRRILRIFPLYYLSLLLFLFVLPLLNPKIELDYYINNQAWLWTYLQNWLYIFKPSGSADVLNHYWSLAVEEQFYLLWPFVILIIKKPKWLLLFTIILLVAVVSLRLWLWVNHIEKLAYFNLYTFTRIDGLCIGSMVTLLFRINPEFLKKHTYAIVIFFAGVNFVFYFFNSRYHFSFPYLPLVGYSTIAMLFGLLVNDAITRQTPLVTKILNFMPLRYIGRISYGFYIFHWPVYLSLREPLSAWVNNHFPSLPVHITSSTIATLLGLLLSILSYTYFEKYFNNLKSRFASS
ncbi:MAG: acyltransferase [Bacteroidetes bacterium]|nr:acyltransferase [Bacteroidota bacterium]MBS1631936.1 acyltransferase [Bacteroidota bacterium]